MHRGVQATEGWGVRPGSRPQASKRLACLLQQQLVSQSVLPIAEEQPVTSNEFLSGFQAGYDAAYLSKATTWGRATRSGCNRTSSTRGIRPTAEGHVLIARKRMSQTIAMMATIRSLKRGGTSHWAFFQTVARAVQHGQPGEPQ